MSDRRATPTGKKRDEASERMAQPATTWQVAGRTLQLTHLDRIEWPEDGLTKADLLTYYREAAPVLLPHCANRPVTIRVFPEGIHEMSYYRRDLPDNAPSWLHRVAYCPSSNQRLIHLPIIDDEASLLWLANAGALEFHLWTARLPDLTKPDHVVFDLDPGEGVDFKAVLRAATLLHKTLEDVGLRSVPKTSGGRGVHVYLPLEPEHPYDVVRTWVTDLATRLASSHPNIFALAHGATHRSDRVIIDAAQNSRGRNTAAPYTARGYPGAPVSAPLTWAEVEAGAIDPRDFTIRTMPTRVNKLGDLFAQALRHDQRLPLSGNC